MKSYQLKFLAWTFSAFLPPKGGQMKNGEGEEIEAPKEDFYELLVVPRSANADDLKKAYRKRSLELHPDKLRQRGMKYHGEVVTEEQARQRFQHMKAAYDVLNDPKKRKVYDALGHQGLDFVINPSHAWDPHVLLANLSKSTVSDRAKLMVLVLIFFGLVLLQPILLCSKVDQNLEENGGSLEDVSFTVILIPFWIFSVCFGAVMVIGKAFLPLVEWISLVAGVLFIALKLDAVISWDFAIVFIPLYVWIILRVYDARAQMNTVKAEMSKMVTIGYIEKYIINEHKPSDDDADVEQQHKVYDDLTPEERDDLNKLYTIVSVPPSSNGNPETDENELEQIERSMEYQEALARYQSAYKVIQRTILPEIPLIVLVTIQLSLNRNWNWGLVFLPVWVSFFLDCCGGCYGFFCTASLAHIEVQDEMTDRLNKQNQRQQEDAAKKEKAEAAHKLAAEMIDEVSKKTEDNDGQVLLSTAASTDPGTSGVEVGPVDTAVTLEAPNATPETGEADAAKDAIGKDDQIDGAMSADDEELLETMFTMDEETYQYFAQAEQEAESKATEAQSKAIGSFCNVLFQLLFAVLFVVKLNQVFEERDDEEMIGTDSFSTFWIIFPLLLIAGCTITCCFCAIFCASDMDSKMSGEDVEEEGANEDNEDGSKKDEDGDAEAKETKGNVGEEDEEKDDETHVVDLLSGSGSDVALKVDLISSTGSNVGPVDSPVKESRSQEGDDMHDLD